jgi:hypothetical protein
MEIDKSELAIAERRWANRQAIANASIEGFVPSPEFLADCEAVVLGTINEEEARARSLARALAAQAARELKMAGLQTKKAS